MGTRRDDDEELRGALSKFPGYYDKLVALRGATSFLLPPMSAAQRYAVNKWVETQPQMASISVGDQEDRRVSVSVRPRSVEKWCATTLEALKCERDMERGELEEKLKASALVCAKAGISILGLRVDDADIGPGGRSRVILRPGHGGPLAPHKLGPRSEVSLRSKSNALPGVVSRVELGRIHVLFDTSMKDIEDLGTSSLRLDARPNDATHSALTKAVDVVSKLCRRGSNDPLRLALLLEESENPSPPEDESVEDASLNDSQRLAVGMISGGSHHPVCLVHGPPGTGKTTTVAAAIANLVKDGTTRVLAVAPSNTAVDNLLERVAVKIDDTTKKKKKKKKKAELFLRLGHPARISSVVASMASMETRLKSADGADVVEDARNEVRRLEQEKKYREARAVRAEVRRRERDLASRLVLTSRVVFATCTGAAHLHNYLKHTGDDVDDTEKFDVVVVDEAAQATEIACWIPLLLGKRAVLAGDHKQLAPTVKAAKASCLAVTLFERLLPSHPSVLLKTQYRMHQFISDWASGASYRHELVPAPSVAEDVIPGVPVLLVIDHAGHDFFDDSDDSNKSISNDREADIVAKHVTRLLTHLPPSDICVIAPYNAQVQALRDRLPDGVDAKTVDGYQGGERDAVVLSLTRSNEKKIIGFLDDDRRLNVAVTRAKRHLCVVCDSDTVRASPLIASLLDHIGDHGDYDIFEG